MRMKDKIAVVTGAGTGIGLAIAVRLASEGAVVVCGDVDNASVVRTADRITVSGGRAIAVRCDVTSEDDVEQLIARAEHEGGPHALVANAAIQLEKTAETTTVDEWDRLLAVNLRGVFLAARAALPRMRELGGGSIVNVASVNGFWVEPELAAYCAAKGGVINLTRSIALDFGRYGIRCNCICPGYIDTGMAQRYFDAQPNPDASRCKAGQMHALGRIGRPEEVAAMALFLCSDEASFCTAQPFIVDGGLSAGVPATADGTNGR
jgi:NAD(P)-dependent dehydrogenase (short-subunit alcohol dehydrogenase family)